MRDLKDVSFTTKRETTFENANVGDRVWTPFGPAVGVGETNASIIQVSKVNDTAMYFDIRGDYNSGRYSIRVNGHSSDDSERTCFWSRPFIIAPERPVREEWVEVEVRPEIMENGQIALCQGLGYNETHICAGAPCGPVQTVKVKVER